MIKQSKTMRAALLFLLGEPNDTTMTAMMKAIGWESRVMRPRRTGAVLNPGSEECRAT